MRRTNSQRFRFAYALSILLILLLNVIMISTTAIAQEEGTLYMALYDCEKGKYLDKEFILLEGKQYDVEVFYENETGVPTRADDVTIDLPWTSFYIASGAEDKWITITTPDFEEYSEFVIIASKEGDGSVEEYVIVSKGDLFVSTDRDTVEENKVFSVTVTDQNDNFVSTVEVIVYIDGKECVPDTTDENGKAYINAPEVNADAEISIIAIKSGYYPGSDTIHVGNVNQPIIDDFISKIFKISPIAFALFLVLFAMLFVKLRKKTSTPLPTSNTDVSQINKKFFRDKKESWDQKNRSDKQTKRINKKIGAVPASAKGSHVEIIRIHSRDDKNKDTKHISDNKKELNKVAPPNKKNEYEWFNGKDTIKYKIDKLTGDVNEKPGDKWFVGEDNVRFKVDKKVIDKKLKKNRVKKAS